MRLAVPLVVVLAACGSEAPPPASVTAPLALDAQPGTPIGPDDPDASIAREEEARLREMQGEGAVRTVPPARRIASAALREVLPGYRFLYLSWQDRAVDPQKTLHTAFGLYEVVAIAPDGSRSRHSGYGNYESFGELLAGARVRIRTQEEAQRVWSAFRDMFQKSWKGSCEQKSPTTWWLGCSESADHRYWYEVTVDADGRVLSGTLRSD